MLCGGGGEGEGEPWFFFCPRQEREARGGRPSRTTPSGYWKAAGTPGVVYSSADRRAIGVKKTMVFYRGRAPAGAKTKWKLNEYKALEVEDEDAGGVPAPRARPFPAGGVCPYRRPPERDRQRLDGRDLHRRQRSLVARRHRQGK